MHEFWASYALPFLILFGLVIIYFTIKNLLPSYFSEKGKNIATQQDITKITELVEEVKMTFTTETEKLKSNLQVLTNMQVSLFSEERAAIIDYNEKYFIWLNSLTDSGLGEIDDRNDQEISNYQKRLSEIYTQFLYSETKFGLFVENMGLKTLADKMKIETLKKLSPHPSKCLHELKQNNYEIGYLKETVPIQERGEKYKALLEKRSEIMARFREQMLEGLKPLAPMNREFQKTCRDHLYKLIQQNNVS